MYSILYSVHQDVCIKAGECEGVAEQTLKKHYHADEVKKLFPDGRISVVFTKGKSLGQNLVSSKHGHEC
jgi:hypothetical protein